MVEFDSQRLLIDPFGRRRCRALAGYCAILITHAHVDHLNLWTLRKLDKRADLYVPQGARALVAELGFASVTEVEPGDELNLSGIEVSCVATRHDPGRWRIGDGPTCTGYVFSKAGVSIYHPGDIDMSDYDVFDRLGRRFDLDVALLPIGGWLPVWYYRRRQRAKDRGVHIDPDTALAIARRLGARIMVPIHWGTLHTRVGPASAPRDRLLELAKASSAGDLVHVLDHGESLSLYPPR